MERRYSFSVVCNLWFLLKYSQWVLLDYELFGLGSWHARADLSLISWASSITIIITIFLSLYALRYCVVFYQARCRMDGFYLVYAQFFDWPYVLSRAALAAFAAILSVAATLIVIHFINVRFKVSRTFEHLRLLLIAHHMHQCIIAGVFLYFSSWRLSCQSCRSNLIGVRRFFWSNVFEAAWECESREFCFSAAEGFWLLVSKLLAGVLFVEEEGLRMSERAIEFLSWFILIQ